METIKTKTLLQKSNVQENYKGGNKGPLGDIGRHGDSKTNIFTNLIQGAMQGHSETTWVIQVDIGTLKLFIVEIL